MALLGNYSVILKNPATFIGGTQVSNCRNAFNANGQNLQMYYGESGTVIPLTSSIPSGTAPPYSWHFAEKGGAIASSTFTSTSPFADGNMGVNGDSIASVIVTGEAVLQLVASLQADGSVTVTASGDGFGSASSPATANVSVVGTLDIMGTGGLLATATVVASPTADIQATGELHSLVYLNQSEATIQQLVDGVVQGLIDLGATGGLTAEEHAQLMKTLTTVNFLGLK
jgi:hypothetical protein